MTHSYRWHVISDKTWGLLEPHLPGREGSWDGIAKDSRLFINAVFWNVHGHTMADGATPIAALSVGAIRTFGKNYLKH